MVAFPLLSEVNDWLNTRYHFQIGVVRIKKKLIIFARVRKAFGILF